MGLLGKGFRDFVGKQIDERQKALGENTSRFSTENKSKAFLTSTPWIRMASSVNLTETEDGDGVYSQMEKSDLFPDNLKKFKEKGLAKNFVLFGGATSLGEDKLDFTPSSGTGGQAETYRTDTRYTSPYSGLNRETSPKPFGGAYGFGDWSQIFSNNGEGYKPMPGITSMDFSYKNDGALSQATVSIKAFSRAQFQIIDVLFQRPGYTVLLEYGHSVFLGKDGEIVYAGKDIPFSTDPFQALFNGGGENPNHYNLSSQIYSEKEKWCGNYEGAFMKITKFNWKYNMDGSYDITVNLIGIGDIISSLKVDVIPIDAIELKSGGGNGDSSLEDLKDLKESGNFLVGNSQSTILNRQLFNIYKRVNNPQEYEFEESIPETIYFNIKRLIDNSEEKLTFQPGVIENFPSPKYQTIEGQKLIKGFDKTKTLIIENGVLLLSNPDKSTDEDEYDDLCYITFGYFISLITRYINLKNDNGIPHIFFDFNYEDHETKTNIIELKDDKNFIATYQGNMSSDPTKILIPFSKFSRTIVGKMDTEVKNDYEDIFEEKDSILTNLRRENKSFFVDGDSKRGRLDRVYLDINYIAKSMDENTSDGECKLIDLINQILKDININLGGINEFRVLFNQDKQLISFVSEVPVNTEEEVEGLFTINTLGLKKRENNYIGSFVKSIDLKAELTDDFATQVSVGSQSNSNRLQSNSGAFSLYNKGLVDRIMGNKIDSQDVGGDENSNLTKQKSPTKRAINKDFVEALSNIYLKYNFETDYIDIIKKYNPQVSSLIIGDLYENNEYVTPFFLPFNLGLTLHGLGGIRIYDGFKIDGKMLPPSYDPTQISLIIKSLSHNVSLDGWVTKIETLPKPIAQLKSDAPLPPLVKPPMEEFKPYITEIDNTSTNS